MIENISKLTISPETRTQLNNPALSQAKRRELREQKVKESIRTSIGGRRTKQELVVAAGYDSNTKSSGYANGLGLVNSMIKRGIISHNNTNQFRKVWEICAEVKPRVTPSPTKIAHSIFGKKEEPVEAEIVVELKEQLTLDKVKLIDMAKDFAWRENSDSLREFIAHMEKAVK